MYFTGEWEADNYIMTEILSTIEFYSGTERRRMLKTPKGTGSMLYGLTWRGYLSPERNRTKSIYKGLYQTKVMDENPDLAKVFKEFANYHFPHFEYVQVQMNKNFRAPPHLDSKNVGTSVLCCFGDYIGGKTVVEYKDELRKFDASEKPIIFNGSIREHWVEEFIGDRYSLVFFNNLRQKLQLRKDL